MFFSRWKYLFRVHFVSPCTSIISTFEYECPQGPDHDHQLTDPVSPNKLFVPGLVYKFTANTQVLKLDDDECNAHLV